MQPRGFYALCIGHPIGIVLLSLALVLCGVIAFIRLPVAPLPEVDAPTIEVTAQMPGASAETMASAVATPLEVQFSAIPGVDDMTSTSSLGRVELILQFNLDKDIDAAAQEVQAAINAASSRLPDDLPELPVWRKINPADTPILILAVTSPTLSPFEVSDLAESAIARQLSQIEGVGMIRLNGLQRPAIRIQARPEALVAAGVTLADVRAAVQRASGNRPTGALVGEHRLSTLDSNGQLFEPGDYAELIVAYRGGAPVRLGDVASVVAGAENAYTQATPNGQPGVAVVIRRQPGANIVATAEAVTAALPELTAGLPADLEVKVLNDRTRTIRASLHEAELTLLIAVGLVIGIMALFLRQWSATLVVFSVLATSVIGACAAMLLFGLSLNNLTLVAIIVAVGFIVDDAIVVVENIHRHLERGAGRMQAALDGVREIGFTVVSISLSLVAVFIPLFFMSGYVGRLFREFALAATSAILISVVICLTLAPALAALFMRPLPAHTGPGPVMGRVLRGYERALVWALDHPRSTLSVFFACIVISVGGFALMPKGFFPLQDTGFMNGTVQASADISYEAMRAKNRQLVEILRNDPDVIAFNADIGNDGSYSVGGMAVVLSDPDDRDATVEQIIDRLRPQFAAIPDLRVTLRAAQDINLGSRASRAQYQYVLRSRSLEELAVWTPQLTERLQAHPLFRDVNNDLQFDASVTPIRIDRDAAARYGFSASDVDDALYDAFGQRRINEIQTAANQYQVVLELSSSQRQRVQSLELFQLRSPTTGQLVPLSTFASVQAQQPAPVSINHSGMLPSANLSFNLAAGVALGDAVAVLRQIERDIGMPASISGRFSGAAQAFQQTLASQPLLILAALVAVYIILGVLYESFVHPLTILSTIPSAGIGALLLLWLWGLDFSIMALIGLILLIGIVKKNGILLVDFALQAQRQGLAPREAIHQACMARFRPILMTTLAAMFGAVPLMLAFGTGAELREPLGVAVVGGLLFSQLLTLLTTPVVYLTLDHYLIQRRRQAPAPAQEAS
ncbi:efflux RND transporter permease subunit [Phytopseudomonas dryadis]|uniref:Acriflavine resistance protein B n=1 Tax=Phytopseudomonas dryadis TaxID=2487520 RepID=A0A4V2KC94_9GAMM|nr:MULTISPECIES: efflux RND transporter permease subunit [Pseudomonas]TBU92699.1 acriflavine resistance protein B [Pseudomonas dryadis]TBV00603.1 acriflavine resistance protein B [Pseudomonas dryadis]TBV14485.1 acriflavine resistance protein B [Pseudomonas sp. FRB 230]